MILRCKLYSTVTLLLVCLHLSGYAAGSHQRSDFAAASTAADGADFALRDGDRVLFYGDSITEQRLYTTYVEHYVLTHYSDRSITFINTGWGGDQVTRNECEPCHGVGGLARIKRDLVDHKPTVVTLLFGMNDGRYYDFDEPTMKVYVDGLTAIIREIKTRTHARVYVMTPSVYDGTRHTSWSHTTRYNDVLDRYSEAAKQIAAREQLPVIDLHTVTTEALMLAKRADPTYTFLNDGVHPEADGQLVMAAEILRAWGAPANGLDLTVSAAIDNPVRFPEGQSHTFAVTAPLAWPQPEPSEKLRAVWPAILRLGSVRLHLTGLVAGSYKISVDGGEPVEFTAETLANGIELNHLSKKSQEDSRTAAELVRKRADWFYTRWRQIQVPYANYRSASAAISGLDSLIAEMAERTRAISGPHKYEITITGAR